MTHWRITLPLLLLLPFVGCVDYEDILQFQADGSGTITIRYNVDLQTMQAVEQMMAGFLQGKDGKKKIEIPVSFKKEEIEKQFKGDGLELKKLEIKDKKQGETTKRYFHIVVAFTHADKLKGIRNFEKQPISFRKVEGKDGKVTYEYARTFGVDLHKLPLKKGKKDGKQPAADPQMIEQIFALMEPVLEGKTVRSTVILPLPIGKTNAAKKEGKQASWSYPLKKMAKKAQRMEATAEGRVVITTGGVQEQPKKQEK